MEELPSLYMELTMKCSICGYETMSMGYFMEHRYECTLPAPVVLSCDDCGHESEDVKPIHTFEDGSTYDMCQDRDACEKRQRWNERPCCGGVGCEGCTPLWELEQRSDHCDDCNKMIDDGVKTHTGMVCFECYDKDMNEQAEAMINDVDMEEDKGPKDDIWLF